MPTGRFGLSASTPCTHYVIAVLDVLTVILGIVKGAGMPLERLALLRIYNNPGINERSLMAN